MATPPEVSDPPLRKYWVEIKKTAGVKAKAKKQDKAYVEFCKQFNLDLGPSLKKWPGYYPNLGKMATERTKIELTITKYLKFVKDGKAALDKSVLIALKSGLNTLKDQLANRTAIAESALMGNEDLALKQAIKESKKKPLKPVVVFNSTDLSSTIMKMVPKGADYAIINELKIQVILADDKVLKKVDDNDGNMAEKIKNAADFAQLKKDIAVGYHKAAAAIKANPDAFNQANSAFESAVQTAIQAATGRASEELNRLADVKVEYRNYRIISGVKLGATIAATTAGVASLAMAPFTGPAMVISAAGVLKGAKVIGDQIADLSMSAEEMIRELQADVKGLNKRYSEWKGSQIGGAEVASTLVNALAPTIFPTIKRCASHADTIVSKINGIETKAGALSVQLNKTLDAQTSADSDIKKWIKDNKKAIDNSVQKSAVKLLQILAGNQTKVTGLIEKISTMNTQVTKARADHKRLDTQIKALSAREPTIAKFAEVLVEIGASVTFLASANVGWPDAYKLTEGAKAVSDMIGNVVGSLDGAVGAAEEMKGFIDDLRG